MGYAERLTPKPVTFYEIKVQANEKIWTVEHRYSEFHELYKLFKKLFNDVPVIPPKTAFKVKSEEEKSKRKSGLDSFIKGVSSRAEMLNHVQFINFLKVFFEENLL